MTWAEPTIIVAPPVNDENVAPNQQLIAPRRRTRSSVAAEDPGSPNAHPARRQRLADDAPTEDPLIIRQREQWRDWQQQSRQNRQQQQQQIEEQERDAAQTGNHFFSTPYTSN